MKRVTRLAFWLIALASVGLGVQVLSNSTGLPGAAAGRPPTRVTGFYLAIGASASLGTQPNGVSSHNGYRSKTGYTSDVAAIEARKGVALDLAPIGCPAETAQSMLSGTDKCYKPPNRQMTVATKYLHEHATKVGLVTIDLGFNNVRPCLWPTVNRACVASGIAMVQRSMPGVLSQLKAAAGPHVHFIGLLYGDPFLAGYVSSLASAATATASLAAMTTLNQVLTVAYTAANVPSANIPGAYQSNNLTPVSTTKFGTVPTNVAVACNLSWMCAAPPFGPDDHPNNAGYLVIAKELVAKLPKRW
jgi:hypothetical protein